MRALHTHISILLLADARHLLDVWPAFIDNSEPPNPAVGEERPRLLMAQWFDHSRHPISR